jgi:hypothetical protein
MSNKVYGYVIIHKETGDQWGGVYANKAGAASAYNHYHNNHYQREKRHKFADQDAYQRRSLVLADE